MFLLLPCAAWFAAGTNFAPAQAFPERPFTPLAHEVPVSAETGEPIPFYYKTAIPHPASPLVAEGLLWDLVALEAHLRAATGDDPSERPAGRATSTGGQYLRYEWLQEPGTEAPAKALVSTSLAASPEELAQCSIPLGRRAEGMFEFQRDGERIPTPLTHGVGDYVAIMFQPRIAPLQSHCWTIKALTKTESGILQFFLPVAARRFAILDVQRPPSISEDSELSIMSGASSRAIRHLPSPEPGFARLLYFPLHDASGAAALELAWAPKGSIPPPQPKIRSTIVNKFVLGFGLARLTSERDYQAPEGGVIDRIDVTPHRGMALTAFRASVPGKYDQSQPGFWTYRPDTPTTSVRLVMELVADFTKLDRIALLPIRDDSYCVSEEVRVEGPASDQIMDSGYEGLRWVNAEEETVPGSWTTYLTRRRLFSTSRRTGRWEASYFHLPGAVPRQVVHKTSATYFADGVGVVDEIVFGVMSGKPEEVMPRPLRLEINRVVEERNLELNFVADAPTTRTLLLADESQAYPGQRVTAIELEWEKPPRVANMRLSFRALGFASSPDTPEVAPVATIIGAESVVRALTLEGAKPMRLLDGGDFQEQPSYEAPAVLGLSAADSPLFELRYMGSAHNVLYPRLPVLLREAGGE